MASVDSLHSMGHGEIISALKVMQREGMVKLYDRLRYAVEVRSRQSFLDEAGGIEKAEKILDDLLMDWTQGLVDFSQLYLFFGEFPNRSDWESMGFNLERIEIAYHNRHPENPGNGRQSRKYKSELADEQTAHASERAAHASTRFELEKQIRVVTELNARVDTERLRFRNKIAELKARIEVLEAENAKLKERVAELEAANIPVASN